MAGVAPGRFDPSPDVGPSTVRAQSEPSAMPEWPTLVLQESSQTAKSAAARPILLMLPADAHKPEGARESEDFLFAKDARPVMTSAQEVRGGINRSISGQATEQIDDLPQMVASMDGPQIAAATRPEEAAGRSALSRHSPAWIPTSSDPVEVLASEMLEGVVSSDRVQAGRADGDRAAMHQGSARLDAAPAMQPDRSISGPAGGNGSRDLSSHLPADGGQSGANFASAAPPRAEELRQGSAALPAYAQSVVDQVAEQIATTARMNPRHDGGHMQLRLHPEALGELVIEVSWKDSGIVAAIKTQSHVAGELLANDLGRLRIALEEQGISISGLGVQVGLDLRQW